VLGTLYFVRVTTTPPAYQQYQKRTKHKTNTSNLSIDVSKILIANRGEIAVRLIRACRDLNISPIAVYSEADAARCMCAWRTKLLHWPASFSGKLSRHSRLLTSLTGERGSHTSGYGFLAENAAFARAVTERVGFYRPDG
jgi:acetyl/propionyl-CoA carboxylase alpha subunit